MAGIAHWDTVEHTAIDDDGADLERYGADVDTAEDLRPTPHVKLRLADPVQAAQLRAATRIAEREARIEMDVRLELVRPPGPYPGYGPWGGRAQWTTMVRVNDSEVAVRSPRLASADTGELVTPWPVGEAAVFANATSPFAVRAELRPGAGLSIDDVPVPGTVSEARCERQIGTFAQAGMHQARFALIKAQDPEETQTAQWYARGPSRDSGRPGWEERRNVMTRTTLRTQIIEARGRRARNRARERDAIFEIPAGTELEADLRALHARYGAERAPNDGMMTVEDADRLFEGLNDPRPAAAAMSIRAIARQTVRTADETWIATIARAAREAVAEVLDARSASRSRRAPERIVTRTAPLDQADERHRVHVVEPGSSPAHLEAAREAALRMSVALATPDRVIGVARAMARWRQRSPAVQVEQREVATQADGRVSTENPTRIAIAHGLMCTARLPGAQRLLGPGEYDIPTDAMPLLDPRSIGTTNGAITLMPTAVMSERAVGGARRLAIMAERAGDAEGEIVTEAIAPGTPLGTAPGQGYRHWVRPEHWHGPITRHIALAGFVGVVRGAMAAKACTQAIGPGQPKIIQPVTGDGHALERAPPTMRARVGFVIGRPDNHEDAIVVSESWAQRTGVRFVRRWVLGHAPPSGGNARPTGIDFDDDAEVAQAARELETTPEQLAKLDAHGVIGEGQTVDPGEPVRLWRDDDGRWEAERSRARAVCTVARVERTVPDDARRAADPANTVTSIIAEEHTTLATLAKIYTLQGMKGMVTVVADARMPRAIEPGTHGEPENRILDVVFDEGTVHGRAAIGDLLAVRIGHLAERAADAAINDVVALAQAVMASDGTARDLDAAVRAIGDEPARVLATLTLERLREARARGSHAALAIDPHTQREGAAPTIASLVPLAPGVDIDAYLDGVETLIATGEATGRTVLEAAHVRLPSGAVRADVDRLTAALAPPGAPPERGFEHVPVRNSADGAMQADTIACGEMDLVLPDLWGRDSASEIALDEEMDPSRPSRHPQRFGHMEVSIGMTNGAHGVLSEQYALSQLSVREGAREAVRAGEAWQAPRYYHHAGEDETGHWLAALGIGWSSARTRARALSDADIMQGWQREIGRDDPQIPGSGRIEGTETGHVKLARAVLHPLFVNHCSDLLGIAPGELERACGIRRGRRGQSELSALPQCLAQMTMNPGMRARSTRVPGGNAADQVGAMITALGEIADNDSTGLMERASARADSARRTHEALAANNADADKVRKAHQAARIAERHANAIAGFVRHGEGRDLPYVMRVLPVVPDRYRDQHPRHAEERELAEAGAYERALRHLVEVNERIKAEDRERMPARNLRNTRAPEATLELHGALARVITETANRLGAKHAVINRHVVGWFSAPGGRRTILPGEPAALGIHQVEIPRPLAEKLYAPWTRDLISGGTEPSEALASAMAAHPIVIVRYPTLHAHSMVCLEPVAVDAPKDGEMRIHPALCQGLGGDHDGDQISFWIMMSGESAEEARAQLGVHRHARRLGDGEAMLAPTHAAHQGCVQAVSDGTESREQLRAWLDTAVGDHPGAQALLAETWNEAPPKDRATWNRWMDRVAERAGESGALEVINATWQGGFEYAQRHVRTIALSSYEDLERVAGWARAEMDARTRLAIEKVWSGNRTSLKGRKLEGEAIARRRHRAWVKQLKQWEAKPETLDAHIARHAPALDAGARTALARSAMEPVRAIKRGARLKWGALLRMCVEIGTPISLTSWPLGVHSKSTLVGGIGAEPDGAGSLDPITLSALTRAGAGSEVSNKSSIGLSGFGGQRLGQALHKLIVTEPMCEQPELLVLPAHALDPNIHAGAVAYPAPAQAHTNDPNTAGTDLDGAAQGTILTAAAIASARLDAASRDREIALRTPAGCAAVHGVCAECAGALRAGSNDNDGRMRLGMHFGTAIATSENETRTQAALKTTHNDGVIDASVPLREETAPEALLGHLQGATARRETLASTFAAALGEGESVVGACDHATRWLHAKLAEQGESIDPTMVRGLVGGMLRSNRLDPERTEIRDLNEIAREAGLHYVQSGLNKEAALRNALIAGTAWTPPREQLRSHVDAYGEGKVLARRIDAAIAEHTGQWRASAGVDAYGRSAAWSIRTAEQLAACLADDPDALDERRTGDRDGPTARDRIAGLGIASMAISAGLGKETPAEAPSPPIAARATHTRHASL